VLYANDVYSVLIVFQAMDAAGKDGMIKHVMSGLNPQGCSFSSNNLGRELDHNFLWRYSKRLPERGRIASSTAATMKRRWSSACIRRFSNDKSCRRASG